MTREAVSGLADGVIVRVIWSTDPVPRIYTILRRLGVVYFGPVAIDTIEDFPLVEVL